MSRAAAVRCIERGRSIAAIGVPTPGGAGERRMQIMDAAARVFAVKGFHGATTQDIADVLGIKQASLYYYFPSKEAALETVCLIGAEGFYERAKAIADGPGTA